MQEQQDQAAITQHDSQLEDATGARRTYSTPRLVEYGDFAKLTQGGSLGGGDTMANSPACL